MKTLRFIQRVIPEDHFVKRAGRKVVTCPSCDSHEFGCKTCGNQFNVSVVPTEEERTYDTPRIASMALDNDAKGYMKGGEKDMRLDWAAMRLRGLVYDKIARATKDKKKSVRLEDDEFDHLLKAVERMQPMPATLQYLGIIYLSIQEDSTTDGTETFEEESLIEEEATL